MASLTPDLPDLHRSKAYYTSDAVLGPVLVFYRARTPRDGAHRIEAHVLSPGGFHSYPDLLLDPAAPHYTAVKHLPGDYEQSPLHQGLAITVLKYFSDLSKPLKELIQHESQQAQREKGATAAAEIAAPGGRNVVAFDEMHAGDLAARLKAYDSETLRDDLMSALMKRLTTVVDVDVVLRLRDGRKVRKGDPVLPGDLDKVLAPFGESYALPGTRLKRAPSKSTKSLDPEMQEKVKRDLDELRKTEESYIAKLTELTEDVAKKWKRGAGETGSLAKDLGQLFPASLEEILKLHVLLWEGIKTGTVENVAKACCKHFPGLKEPYVGYFSASEEFPAIISRLMSNSQSMSTKIQSLGEQKLRSLIIEPVQRLPRYSLLFDSIIGLLPPLHPAQRHLGDAKDIISEICSIQDSAKAQRSSIIKRLKAMIVSWPDELRPLGRLVAAVDCLDISPPYSAQTADYLTSILLIFPECLILLRRPKETSIKGQALLLEVDKPGGGSAYGSGSKRDALGYDLLFSGWIDNADVRLHSSADGNAVWMIQATDLKDACDPRSHGKGIRKLELTGQYEGRPGKVEEEFAKAKLERRAGGRERSVYDIRQTRHEGLHTFSCIWTEHDKYMEARHKSPNVMLIDFGGPRPGPSAEYHRDLTDRVGKDGVDFVSSAEQSRTGLLKLNCRGILDHYETDAIQPEDLLAVFTKKMLQLLKVHHSPNHPLLTAAYVSGNRKLLRSLGIPYEGEGRFSKLRAPSPVKLISSILNTPSPKVLLERSQSQILPPRSYDRIGLSRGATALGIPGENGLSQKITMADSTLVKLEEAFEALVTALRMTGSEGADFLPLHDMGAVDRAAVDTFLKQILEDPRNCRVDQSLTVDIVFGALNEFLNREWKDGMGAMISPGDITLLREKSDTMYPQEFEDHFKLFVMDWAPQNKRAFRTMLQLLTEMQAKTGDEDVKGILTKAFTELLVGKDLNALEYMGLVDRLVQDMESLFREPALDLKRSKSATGTSTIRRRLGLGHSASLREGSRPDREERSHHSVWRTLSKRDKEGHLARSKSIDHGSPKRPASQDRPAAFNGGTPGSRPTIISKAPVLLPTTNITQAPTPTPGRRKRRSSLSDLTSHPEYKALVAELSVPLGGAGKAGSIDRRTNLGRTFARPSSPVMSEPSLYTSSSSPTKFDKPAPLSTTTKPLHIAAQSSENLPTTPVGSQIPVPASTPKKEDLTGTRGRGRANTSATPRHSGLSSIPQRRTLPKPFIRDRSQTIDSSRVDPSLLQEITRLGSELNHALTLSPTTHTAAATIPALQRLTNTLAPPSPQEELKRKDGELGKREKELKETKQLLKDARAENDIMFERFNLELAKIARGGESELRARLAEAVREVARLKVENGNLKERGSTG